MLPATEYVPSNAGKPLPGTGPKLSDTATSHLQHQLVHTAPYCPPPLAAQNAKRKSGPGRPPRARTKRCPLPPPHRELPVHFPVKTSRSNDWLRLRSRIPATRNSLTNRPCHVPFQPLAAPSRLRAIPRDHLDSQRSIANQTAFNCSRSIGRSCWCANKRCPIRIQLCRIPYSSTTWRRSVNSWPSSPPRPAPPPNSSQWHRR